MKRKSFGIGLVITLSTLIYGFSSNDWETSVKIIAFCALIPLLVTGVLSGAFVSGDRNRANYHTKVDRDEASKNKWSISLLMFSAPNAISLLVIVLIAMKG
ncbi:DUF5316 domain-containing protein [Halobacillus sp. GSS1]|uniref:DUF5316 domain-containing protein n=1 Tax=Halobacillus sp. GSS1 TaxID=2815919 RepID=UPI001A8D103B|nr:DUF5316 domain-containing protein [Halobacillus sp. GSS1]